MGLEAELRADFLWNDPRTIDAVLSTLDPLAGSPVSRWTTPTWTPCWPSWKR